MREALTQAIEAQPDEPWFYFNRAPAWSLDVEPDFERAAADCAAIRDIATAMKDPLVASAGYACEANYLLNQQDELGDSSLQPHIRQALAQITVEDWAFPYYLRGRLNLTDLPTEARLQFACYLLLVRDEAKPPLATLRVNTALYHLRDESRSLETLCPFSFEPSD